MSRGGAEYALRHGDYTAVVTEVGGGLRSLTHGGRDLVLSYAADEIRPRYFGALLAPWPNRIADGRYVFGGEEHQVPLNEPGRRTALHGLVAWSRFVTRRTDEATVVMTHRLVPRTGYPFDLEITATYALGDSGLVTTVRVVNVGSQPAPWGTAPHPYLKAGDGKVDDWVLTLPADEVLDVTPDRLLPIGEVPVADLGFDFRQARALDGVALDHAFCSLRADGDGLVRVDVTDDSGAGVACAWDPTDLPWVQVHTADLDDPATTRQGLAVEPMTCPPDAFNSGNDLVVLEPGAESVVSWTLHALG
jgi:aldose 1-epimerase